MALLESVTSYLWCILPATILLVFYLKVKRAQSFWQRKGVIHIKPKFFVGSLSLWLTRPLAHIAKGIYDAFPEERYHGSYAFLQPTLVIKDPDLIKQITIKDFDHFTDHRPITTSNIDPFWKKNLIASTGQEWKELRSTLSPSFTSSKMKILFGLIEEVAKNFVEHFKHQEEGQLELEMKETLRRFTTDVIASAAFGIKSKSLEDDSNDFYVMGREVVNFSGLRFLRFFFYLISPTLANLLKIKIIPTKVANFFSNIVRETVEMREKEHVVRPDMINLLMEARKGREHLEEKVVVDEGFSSVAESEIFTSQKRKEITMEDITAQAIIFFLAGFETVSTFLSFLFYELAANPDIQEKLREELNSISGEVTYESLLHLKYLDMVVSETLRKWPPTNVTDRVVTKPYTIQPVKEGEKPLHLEEGIVIMFYMFGIHRDPKIYPEPERFDPERFNEANRHKINPQQFLPFGAGPRSCIGSRFALLESKLLVYYVLKNFEIVPVKKTNIPMVLDEKVVNVSSKGGMWLGLKKIK